MKSFVFVALLMVSNVIAAEKYLSKEEVIAKMLDPANKDSKYPTLESCAFRACKAAIQGSNGEYNSKSGANAKDKTPGRIGAAVGLLETAKVAKEDGTGRTLVDKELNVYDVECIFTRLVKIGEEHGVDPFTGSRVTSKKFKRIESKGFVRMFLRIETVKETVGWTAAGTPISKMKGYDGFWVPIFISVDGKTGIHPWSKNFYYSWGPYGNYSHTGEICKIDEVYPPKMKKFINIATRPSTQPASQPSTVLDKSKTK